jgi:hypothetical protein
VRARVDAGERALSHLGPTKVLERGYSITSIEGRTQPLRDAASVRSGQTLVTRLARGEIRSLVRGAAAQPSARPPDTNRQPSLFENTKSRTDENGTRGAKHD